MHARRHRAPVSLGSYRPFGWGLAINLILLAAPGVAAAGDRASERAESARRKPRPVASAALDRIFARMQTSAAQDGSDDHRDVIDDAGEPSLDQDSRPMITLDGCSPNSAPTANAGPDRSITVGAVTIFDGSGSLDSDGGVVEYWWNFGDGSYTGWQAGAAASHAYAQPGNFTARLWVRDNCGAMSLSDSAAISVANNSNPCTGNQPPVAAISGPQTGAPGQSLSFSSTGSNDPDGQLTAFNWSFGDGTQANSNAATHVFAQSGSYAVTLTVTDNCNVSRSATLNVSIQAGNPCSNNTAPIANAGPDRSATMNSAITLDGSGSSDASGTVAEYWWNFGDNSFTGWQTSPTASHIYAAIGSYMARLWVRDNCGALSVSDIATISVTQSAGPCSNNQPPTASIEGSQSGAPNQPLSFGGGASSDPNGQITGYQWSFGDGSTASGVSVSHAFAQAGTFVVTLTVTDNCNASHSATRSVTIQSPNPCTNNTPPTANAGPDRTATVNVPLMLDGSASTDSTGQIVQYWWNFGDGTYSGWENSPMVSHTYVATGTFFARLWTRDQCGATSLYDLATVSVNPAGNGCTGNQAPVANAGGAPEGEVGELLSFSAIGSSDPNGQSLSFHWTFSDGVEGSGMTFSRSFATAGVIAVTLLVTDPCGATASDDYMVSIYCTSDANCPPDDPNTCTDHYCGADPADGSRMICRTRALACCENGGECDDGNACTVGETCANGVCGGGTERDCDDDNFCTSDSCHPTDGCDNAPANEGQSCDDGDVGTIGDRCEAGECVGDLLSVSCSASISASALQVQEGASLTFQGSGTTGAGLEIVSYRWRFGDQCAFGQTITRPFHVPGGQEVTLTVRDSAGCEATASIDVNVTAVGGPLVAQFDVYKLAQVTSDGCEVWEPVDLEGNEEVELGLRLKYDASRSTGPVALGRFYFGNSTWIGDAGPGASVEFAFDSPGTKNVTLTVYNAAWTQSNVRTESLSVSNGIEVVASSDGPNPASDFYPLTGLVVGDTEWIVSNTGRLGSIGIADPSFPDYTPIQIISESVTFARRMWHHSSSSAEGGHYLFIARASNGIDIWRTDSPSPYLVRTFATPTPATSVASWQDTLWVGGQSLYGYSISLLLSGEAPTPTSSYVVEGGAREIATAGNRIVTGGNDSEVTIFTFLPNLAPTQVTLALESGEDEVKQLCVAGDRLLVRHGSGISIVDLNNNEVLGFFPALGSEFVADTGNRLYEINHLSRTIYKHDITNPADTYILEAFVRSGVSVLRVPHLVSTDYGKFLFVGERSAGVSSYRIDGN